MDLPAGNPVKFILGDVFMRKYYVHFDHAGSRIGITESQWKIKWEVFYADFFFIEINYFVFCFYFFSLPNFF